MLFRSVSQSRYDGVCIGKTSTADVPNAKLDVYGNVIITGSLKVTAPITASNLSANTITVTNLNVTTISSSVVYSSGSNTFGNLISNKHQFTGSVEITGSGLNVMGNVGIGTYSPSYKLDVSSNNDSAIRIRNGNGNASNGIALGVGANTPWLWLL